MSDSKSKAYLSASGKGKERMIHAYGKHPESDQVSNLTPVEFMDRLMEMKSIGEDSDGEHHPAIEKISSKPSDKSKTSTRFRKDSNWVEGPAHNSGETLLHWGPEGYS